MHIEKPREFRVTNAGRGYAVTDNHGYIYGVLPFSYEPETVQEKVTSAYIGGLNSRYLPSGVALNSRPAITGRGLKEYFSLNAEPVTTLESVLTGVYRAGKDDAPTIEITAHFQRTFDRFITSV